MKNVIFCFLISSLFFSSGNLHSSQKSDVEASIPKRLLTDSGFVEFLDYFGPFSTSKVRGHIRKLILPLIFESKIGSKEPKNRQKLNPLTVSNLDHFEIEFQRAPCKRVVEIEDGFFLLDLMNPDRI